MWLSACTRVKCSSPQVYQGCPHARVIIRFGQEEEEKAGEHHKVVGISWLL